MYKQIVVVGAGRVGTPIASRLAERFSVRVTRRELECSGADLVVLCTPDSAISDVAARIEKGPWICHVSGATRLDALAPHAKRFSVHPLQTFQAQRGAQQFDGAFAAVSAETAEGRAVGFELAEDLALRPFALEDELRPVYHAGATVAASFLVTIQRVAAELLEAAGAPPEALTPLMRRVIENDFAPTGPHVRGDVRTIEGHVAAIAQWRPELEPIYLALADATKAMSSP